MVLSNNPDKNILDPVIEENPIHDILKSCGANIEELHKSIDFDDWTRWGKNNRYSARLIRGVVGDEGLIYRDFTSSEKPKVVFFNNLRDPSEEELFFRESMIEQAYQEADLETQRKHEEAAISANQLWEEARIEGASEYLDKKQVMAYGLRFSEDQHGRFVMVPLYDASGKLWNVQKIYDPRPNGSNNKWFVTGGRKKGCSYLFGASLSNLVNQDGIAETFFVCEGYATGLSLHAALRSVGLKASVVVCFSASNMLAVADQVKGLRFIFADNDESKTGEEFAEKTGLPWTMADTVGFDANDLHKNNGLFALVGKIMGLRNQNRWKEDGVQMLYY
jgi:putative DNA primase/helicase